MIRQQLRPFRLWVAVVAATLVAGCGSPTTVAPPTVWVRTASVAGQRQKVLTDAAGMTLYVYTPDTLAHISCSGSCTEVWPALILKSGKPTAGAGVGGTLGTVNGANGRQVTYDGHPLYTYEGDSAPGQANGEGEMGLWYVAQPGMP